ncbi:hypothetical protein [uncultured Xanthomonas sp.]|uniref:hypothetical protein n=1 Tax=uncultured Xanthomonas sp. TaxID=152831 RepID=UPI0025E865C9|nr:hypothetical protein [uncultured Xanthomonas sp.]
MPSPACVRTCRRGANWSVARFSSWSPPRWGEATMVVLTLSYAVFAIGYSLFRLFGGRGSIDLDQLWREVLNAVLGLC